MYVKVLDDTSWVKVKNIQNLKSTKKKKTATRKTVGAKS